MEMEDEGDSATAGRGEGGADAPAAHARPSDPAAASTSASVERLFSVAGHVVTAKRASLNPTTVTLLVFLHEAIPRGVEREAYEIIEAALTIDDD